MDNPSGFPRAARGDQLTAEDKRIALASFVHRYTGNHVPNWVRGKEWKDGKPYPLQFANDDDWLRNTWFKVRLDGRLHGNGRYCFSRPTWPQNPELRKAL